ncbi:MAG: GIDE domain-containing protein [Gammaproteobacteria bacterium]
MTMLGDPAGFVRGLDSTEFALLLAALGAVALVAFVFIWRNLRRARIIEDTPTARVRSAAQGYVELEGRGRLLDGPAVRAPLTGMECLWWRFKVERRETAVDSRGRRFTSWNTVNSGASDDLFLFDDGTGTCVIDPHGADVVPGARQVWYGGSEWPRVGPRTGTGLLGAMGGNYRYTEERLMPGRLYALGWFRTVSNADLSLSEEVSALLRQWKLDKPRLLRRFDANGDGTIDAGEWEGAREAALEQIQAERQEEAREPATNTLARPDESRYPFILAATPQEALTRRFRLRAAGALAAQGMALVLLLWAVAARHG